MADKSLSKEPPYGDSRPLEQNKPGQPRTPTKTQPSTSSTYSSPSDNSTGSILTRPKPATSPFFGRPTVIPKSSTNTFSQRESQGFFPVQNPLDRSPKAVVKNEPRLFSEKQATKPLPRFALQPTSVPTSDIPSSAPPRRQIKPDNWWQKDKAPAIPEKSPLRAFLSNLPASEPVSPTPKQQARGSDSEDLLEQEVLRAELSPPPLRITKATTESSSTPKRIELPLKTSTTPDSQANLQASDHLSSTTEEAVTKEELAQQSLTVVRRSDLAEKVEETEDSYVRRHRKITLDILEGSFVPHFPKEFAEFGSLVRSPQDDVKPEMDSLHPESAAALTAHRREAIRLAKSQERAVVERCKRSNQDPPGYTFDELIGKGSFGRVYKGRQIATAKIVAIKVLDIDDADFQAYGEQKDEQIKDFNREIRILRQAQDSGAENLNQMIEALPIHSQLWLICEYCPGGSVKTLMRATNDRLAEKYLVIVARELGKALKGLHAAGIIHRDVKAANVLIHEEGRLELCDFGVANVLDTRTDKRRTFIGTLHWMPPELWSEKPEYSDEVDVWEYGCTLYECALGRPPNSDLRERQQLKTRMRRLKQAICLPENEQFSDGLRDLVRYALTPEVTSRPSMKDVLEHEYLAETEDTHPTTSLTELVKDYYAWLFGGGQRVSLFMPGGAAAAATEDPDADIQASDEWNFSMTRDFERRVSAILEIPDLSELSAAEMEGEETPKQPKVTNLSPPRNMTAAQKANFESRVNRGAADLSNIFNADGPSYEYKTKTDFVPVPEPRRTSDLPFRAMAEDRPSSIASNVIDLGDFDEADYAVAAPRTDEKIQTAYADTPMREQTIRLADASTLRQKRADSKGPREPQSLTARRASSADDASGRAYDTSSSDFAAAQQEWTLKSKDKAPELQEAAEITSASRPGHATMDWSFADAMKGAAAGSTTSEPEYPTSTINEPKQEETSATSSFASKSKARATLDWSFSEAFSELNSTATADNDNTSTSGIQHSPPTSRTPKRPAPLHRQMTMPVTQTDFDHAREDPDPPRPSTALSEAYSESSQSSADVDPFGLESQEEDYPGPATMDDVGVSGYYATRGRTMFAGDSGRGYPPVSAPPGGVAPAPYPSASVSASSAGAVAGGVSGGAYQFGQPVRVGEPGFPGPAAVGMPLGARVRSHERGGRGSGGSSTNASGGAGGSGRGGSGGGSGGVGGGMGRRVIEVPDVRPPSESALRGEATAEEVEGEVTRLLEGLQDMLGVAAGVVQGLDSGRGRGRGLGRGAGVGGAGGDSEWEDEE